MRDWADDLYHLLVVPMLMATAVFLIIVGLADPASEAPESQPKRIESSCLTK